MATLKSTIQGWIENRPATATHMIVVCDTFDWEDYPVYFPNTHFTGATLEEVIGAYHERNMQKVMEVYSFTGVHTIESQLAEFRARHLD